MDEEDKMSDLEMLEKLRNKLYTAISDNEPQPKVGDLLKVIDLKRKLTVEGKGERKFWDMVNKIREQELSGIGKRSRKRKAAK